MCGNFLVPYSNLTNVCTIYGNCLAQVLLTDRAAQVHGVGLGAVAFSALMESLVESRCVVKGEKLFLCFLN